MSDFQKYLDEAFSKINTSDFSDSEEDLPRDDVYKEIQQLIVSERKKTKGNTERTGAQNWFVTG